MRPPLLGCYLSHRLDDLDRLNLNIDLDLVANRQATCLECHVPGQPEIATIDLAPRAEASPLATPSDASYLSDIEELNRISSTSCVSAVKLSGLGRKWVAPAR